MGQDAAAEMDHTLGLAAYMVVEAFGVEEDMMSLKIDLASYCGKMERIEKKMPSQKQPLTSRSF
jgi:hypothetical protein